MFRDNDRENHNLVISHFVLLTEYKQKCNNDVEGGKKKKDLSMLQKQNSTNDLPMLSNGEADARSGYDIIWLPSQRVRD